MTWSKENNMSCNSKKCNENLSSEVKKTILNLTPYLTFLNAVVLFYWGVTIQSDCKFRVHVNLKLIKANKCLNDLRTLTKEQYSKAEIDHLFKFLVLPNFIYGLPAWSFWTWYQYQGSFFRNWPMRVKWTPFFNFRGPFFKTGVPQNIFQLIGTECSMRRRRFIEIIIYRLASTEHEVKMTLMLKHKWKASLLDIYSALSSNVRMNNFVSFRPQVLREKSLCDS